MSDINSLSTAVSGFRVQGVRGTESMTQKHNIRSTRSEILNQIAVSGTVLAHCSSCNV